MFCSHLLVSSPSRASLVWCGLDESGTVSERRVHLRDMGQKAQHDDGLDGALSLTELAARLHVKPQAIYDLRSEGRGPKGFRVGSQLRFRESVIEDWIRRLEEEDEQRHYRSSR